MSPAPMRKVQKEAAAARGKAMVRAPTWSGTTTMARPSIAGATAMRAAEVAWKVRTWGVTSPESSESSTRLSPPRMPVTAVARPKRRAAPM